jgi:hypothetical protein
VFLVPYARVIVNPVCDADSVRERIVTGIGLGLRPSVFWVLFTSKWRGFTACATSDGFLMVPGNWIQSLYRPLFRIKISPGTKPQEVAIIAFPPGVVVMLAILIGVMVAGRHVPWSMFAGLLLIPFGLHCVCWLAFLLEKKLALRQLIAIINTPNLAS